MMYTQITMAGLTIGVRHLSDKLRHYPACFLTEGADCDFTVSVSEEDVEQERIFMRTEEEREGREVTEYLSATLEMTAIYRKIARQLPFYDAFAFHGSAVAVGERAFVFTARSGVGKTTHTRLWLKNIPGSYVVNGDKPVLRLIDGKAFVCGTLWMGKERLGASDIVPLDAICLLERGEENRIREIPFKEAMPALIAQMYRSPDPAVLAKSLKLLGEIGKQVRICRLTCNMEDEAALVSAGELLK